MKKNHLLILAALLPIVASAYDAKIDGIYYNFSGNEASVTYKIIDSPVSYSGDVVIPESVTYDGKTYYVTEIGNGAFKKCSGVTSVTIGKMVRFIDNGAFSRCSGLTSITIPEGVTSIGRSVFYECTNLTSITIPESLTSIGENAFYNTGWYRNQADGLVYAGNIAYEYKGTMPEGTQIIIKEGTIGIAGAAFWDCANMTSIIIPNSVTNIGMSAFRGCTGLTSITIPNSVTVIEEETFAICSGLSSVSIPNSVTRIGKDAFNCCYNLSEINIPESVTSIGQNAFLSTDWFESQPDGMIYVGKVAYIYKGTMPEGAQITIKEGTLGIGDYAFASSYKYDRHLHSITLPESISNIGDYAFSGCIYLGAITLPANITYIGAGAFYSTNLSFVRVESATPIDISDNTFPNRTRDISLYVPEGSKAAYEAAEYWNEFKEISEDESVIEGH